MTNKNTRSKGEYALDHILWGLISWLWFTKSLFRNIEGLSYDRSRLILLGTLTASILLGLAVTWKRRRNNLSLFVNLVLPYEIYTLIVYRETAPVLIRILIITSVCLSVIYAVLVLSPHIRAGARKAVVLWRRLTHSALGIRTIAACCLSVLLLALGASAVFGIAFFSPSTAADDPLDHEEVTLEENIDVVYRRFHEQGRMMPDGVRYVDSWVTTDGNTCYQINESRSEALLHEWAANRSDVTDFEFIPVISSREMCEKMAQEA